ncbi:prealbumin-like fold domain-containing protein [Roseisolibacter agri]|nr:prealbumin-like fold domain-containing protein [Roseisolibacter agri]
MKSSMRWLALLPVAVMAAAVACRDDTVAPQLTPSDAPQRVLTGSITDEYTAGTPVHGAIFTTTPDGDVVNGNTKYTQKIEVYLDGGPRNANSQAAGLPDGLYVFQITDPPGKLLLSKDPARCRVVQVDGGVIKGTVAVASIPGQDPAAADVWGGSGSTKNNPCHVEDAPEGAAGASGQHDTNADTELGGGTTVQMMPFFDTPNNGGVYKAWITPLKAYLEKGGNLNTQTAGVYSSSPRTLIGYAPDPGFKNPGRNFVKTDNFKVVENPPFIRISKILDGAPYTGWPVTVYELIEGEWVGAGFRPTVATFAIPLGTDVQLLACEAILAGSAPVSATVGGVNAPRVTGGTPAVPTTDGQGHELFCVAVPGTASATTIDVVFTNASPDARISISPLDDTNGIGEPHVLTALVQQDDKKAANTGGGDAVTGFGPAPNGTLVTLSLTNSNGATATFVGGNTCTTTSGTCTVTINSPTAGTVVIHATTTFSVNGVSLTRSTGPGLATAVGDDARKIYSAGSLSWVKIDAATPPRYLAGATFRVRRTHDRFGAAVSTPDLSVTDNVAPDANSADGQFLVAGLPLGRYCIKETAAPAGYLLDPTEQCGDLVSTLNLSIASPNGSANPFVNSLEGRMTGGSGKIEITLPNNGGTLTISTGFTIHCDITLSNNIEINWPGNRWHLDKPIKTATCLDDPNVIPDQPDAPFDTFLGTAEGALNGQAISRISFTFVDGDGSPGGKANDRVSLTIWNTQGQVVLSFTNLPIKGNLQAHEDQPHK